MKEQNINFDTLVSQIEYTNEALQNNARLVINRHVTAKAWLTGYYIVEYEQNGSDRAKYGDRLIVELAKRLKTNGDNKCSKRTLELYRTFYLTYCTLAGPIQQYFIKSFPIAQSLIAQSDTIRQSPIAKFKGVAPDMLFNRLSFTHLAAILPCKDPLKRAFYETMAIRGTVPTQHSFKGTHDRVPAQGE